MVLGDALGLKREFEKRIAVLADAIKNDVAPKLDALIEEARKTNNHLGDLLKAIRDLPRRPDD